MTVEEKARKYAGNLIPTESLYFDAEKISLNIENTFIESKYDAFISGYTQAVTDLNAENEKLREALREIIEECEAWTFPTGQRVNDNNYNHSVDIGDLKLLIAKAKQLIIEYDKKSI